MNELKAAHRGRAILKLRAGTMPGGVHLERNVDAELTAAAPDPLEYSVNISWEPKGTALLPRFNGILRFQWDEDYGNTWLIIEGDYEPPLGDAGKAFDAVIGQRIARGTLRALLDDFRSVIETAHTQPTCARPHRKAE